MLSFNLLVLHSARYYHTDGYVSITHLLNQTRKQQKVGTQGHDKELPSIKELFPADTCRPGSTNHCHLEHMDPKLGSSFNEVFSSNRTPIFFYVFLYIKVNNLKFHTNLKNKNNNDPF